MWFQLLFLVFVFSAWNKHPRDAITTSTLAFLLAVQVQKYAIHQFIILDKNSLPCVLLINYFVFGTSCNTTLHKVYVNPGHSLQNEGLFCCFPFKMREWKTAHHSWRDADCSSVLCVKKVPHSWMLSGTFAASNLECVSHTFVMKQFVCCDHFEPWYVFISCSSVVTARQT